MESSESSRTLPSADESATTIVVAVVVGMSLLVLTVLALVWVQSRAGVKPSDRDAAAVGPAPAEVVDLTLPAFSLVDQSGQPRNRESFAGRVTIFGFIFTRCPGLCPMVTGVMSGLRKQLPAEVRLASLTVDPDYDAPAILTEYARTHAAPLESWWFLTGERKAVYELIQDGFRLPVAENPDAGPGEEIITHTPRLALVDGSGRIRGFFDSRQPDQMERLRQRALDLLRAR